MKIKRLATYGALVFTVLCGGVRQADSVPVISLGTPIPITADTFALPIEITDAVEVIAWSVGLNYDPTDVQINTICDPFSGDIYCSLLTNAFTEGDFFASGTPFNLLVEGVVELDPITFEQTGVMFAFAGAYGGFPPAPSGDGVLGYVEFRVLGDGSSEITLTDADITSSAVPEPATLVLFTSGLLLLGARRLTNRRRRDQL